MCSLWGKNRAFISQKTVFFIVTAVKTSNLTQHWPAELSSGDVMCFLWGKNWGFYILADGILLIPVVRAVLVSITFYSNSANLKQTKQGPYLPQAIFQEGGRRLTSLMTLPSVRREQLTDVYTLTQRRKSVVLSLSARPAAFLCEGWYSCTNTITITAFFKVISVPITSLKIKPESRLGSTFETQYCDKSFVIFFSSFMKMVAEMRYFGSRDRFSPSPYELAVN
jgi:hypothetical protein